MKYCDEEDAWSVVSVTVADTGREITAVGNLAGVQSGEHLRLTGTWNVHPKWGRQLVVSSWMPVTPATLAGIERYLGSGLVKGIGPELAGRLVSRFGLETLEVIDRQPERMREVEGIGPVRSRQIREAWGRQREIRDVMVFLQSHDLAPSLAVKVWRAYGARARAVLQQNPYRLAEDIAGVGFRTADAVARRLGIAEDAPARLEAAVLHLLARAAEDGDLYVPREKLATGCEELVGTDRARCVVAIDGAIARGAATEVREGLVGLPRLVSAETGAADLLARLDGAAVAPVDADPAIAAFERDNALCLSTRQREAIEAACRHKVLVITGGPGTGKTTLVRAIVVALEGAGLKVALCAPTGRAAKRLAEATGHEARTIHRLLEYSAGVRGGESAHPRPAGFQRTAARPLECDALVADESSMIDLPLLGDLLAALPPKSRLVLVGDRDQLPSVGPGSVLRDVIASGAVPVVTLDEVFRQSQASAIVLGAHAINAGRLPSFPDADTGDLFFVERDDPERALDTVIEVATRRIPRRFGLDPRRDVQVLAPMQRGSLGVANLNRRLQELLAPAGPAIARAGGELRAGDRVMQTRNDYDRGVFNGDIGLVERVDPAARELSVRFDERLVDFDWTDLDDLALAWACSIHKSQGSEYPGVVIALHTQHYVLLQRTLLYTAVTRARRVAVIVGSRRALGIAVRNAAARERCTLLAARLRERAAERGSPPLPIERPE